jgi:hypothetical protein
MGVIFCQLFLSFNTSASQQSQSVETKPRTTYSNKPIKLSYRINDSVKFDFQGCSRSSNSNDVLCVGNFRSLNGDREIQIGPKMKDVNISGSSQGINITNSEWQIYSASEVNINDNWSCNIESTCAGGVSYNPGIGRLSLIEGIEYKTTFVFRDVSLPSVTLPLFHLSPYEIKVRNTKVAGI